MYRTANNARHINDDCGQLGLQVETILACINTAFEMSGLTSKQERFCQETVKGQQNQSGAYRVAYHPKASISKKAVHELPSQLRKNPKITSRISELQAPVVEAAQLSLAQRLQELSYAAFLDPIHAFDEHGRPLSIREMPEHVRRAIASYEIDPEKFITNIRFVDKRWAIMDYSKLAGDIPDREERPESPQRGSIRSWEHLPLEKRLALREELVAVLQRYEAGG